MARKLRVEYADTIYHVMNRGDRRELIFIDDADRRRFVETLGEVCAKTGWQVQAYVLMPNHFHLVVETPQPNLVAGMKWLPGTYTSRFNRRHKLFGHLELIIAEELKRRRWQEADLKIRPKGDSAEVALAARLRAQTSITAGWIAERLAMRTRGYMNILLYRRRKLGRE